MADADEVLTDLQLLTDWSMRRTSRSALPNVVDVTLCLQEAPDQPGRDRCGTLTRAAHDRHHRRGRTLGCTSCTVGPLDQGAPCGRWLWAGLPVQL